MESRMDEKKETEDLLAAFRGGDSSAFALLCEKYDRLLQGAAHRFSAGLCETDTAEVRQEARIALFRAAQSYRPSADVTFGLYARVCVRNALISRYRKKKAVLCSLEDSIEGLLDACGEEPYATLSAAESLEDAYRRIASVLSPYERQVFDLYMEGESAATIGTRLQKTEKSVYNAISRTLSKLRVEFGGSF